MSKRTSPLKLRRMEREMTQKQVAELVGVSERHYQEYEYGTEPAVLRAIRIGEVLGIQDLVGLKALFANNKKTQGKSRLVS